MTTSLHTIGARPTLSPAWAVVAYTTAHAARACRMSLRASDDRRVLDEVRADTTPPPARFVVLA